MIQRGRTGYSQHHCSATVYLKALAKSKVLRVAADSRVSAKRLLLKFALLAHSDQMSAKKRVGRLPRQLRFLRDPVYARVARYEKTFAGKFANGTSTSNI